VGGEDNKLPHYHRCRRALMHTLVEEEGMRAEVFFAVYDLVFRTYTALSIEVSCVWCAAHPPIVWLLKPRLAHKVTTQDSPFHRPAWPLARAPDKDATSV
jgi:hypothetical protein